jgi:hypothetical protein
MAKYIDFSPGRKQKEPVYFLVLSERRKIK